MRDDIKIIFQDLPSTIRGFTVSHDGYYTIILNSKLNHEQNQLSYIHEILHIDNDDFSSNSTADKIEQIAHDIN